MDLTLLDEIVDKTIPEHFLTTHENDSQKTPRKQRYNPYLTESDEKREARLAANRERMRNMRMNETPEQKQARLEANRERMKANREKYSEQRRRMRALETPEKREKRLLANRLRNRNARLFETEEQRERRRAENRERQRQRRAQETPEEVEMRRSYNRARMTIRRSIMKLQPKIEASEYSFPKQEPATNYTSDNDLDVDLDYVIPDVVINMVDEADPQSEFRPNPLLGMFDNDVKPDFNLPMAPSGDGLPIQPSIGEYIQKCITTIDNILNSDNYQNVNMEQQQSITETALGRRSELNDSRTDQFAELVLNNIGTDGGKCNYN
ncbi:traf2 and NCK-interacting protein kinase-like isoform X3 [Ctenocephalides felis]|uniref:traf2 and NCK-interacting protein kinase-like isoform X3 n=1 Tax=Ctenocephalides felis TaxID=7515 RepID=UPI000E6E4D20|nr:traf2 and NCK-interacting protein kinase-like isoform X3 [Ctenocephalides felis]